MFEDEIGSRPPEFSNPYLFQVGDVVDGRYFVRTHLGQGGMGAVLRVEDLDSHETIALKYCRPGENRARFAREVRMMEQSRSDYVIGVIRSNLDHVPPYFVMPLAERSLQSDLATLAGDEITGLEIFRQICLGVRHLHENGIFHRDLKPANVLRLPDGRMVVSDLGLGRFEDRDTTILTRTIHHLGTEDYLAPEQRQPDGSRNADARTDVYQLGKVLYQIITGRPPRWIEFDKLPNGLDHIVRRATAENPGDRYQDVARLEAALSSYRSSKDPLRNPRGVLEELVTRLEGEYPTSIPADSELAHVLETLSHGAWLEHSLVIECFHRVPIGWVTSIAQNLEPLLYPVLGTYTSAIHERVASTNYSFADDVAARMRLIYGNASTIRTKVLALRNLMTSAERLNRYIPQKAFCQYLENIKTIDLALPVSEMITEYARPYINQFRGYNIDLYHPAIQDALRSLHSRPATPFDQPDEPDPDLQV